LFFGVLLRELVSTDFILVEDVLGSKAPTIKLRYILYEGFQFVEIVNDELRIG